VCCLAGLAVGYWKSVDDLQQQWSIDRNLPEMPKKIVDKLLKTGTKPLGALETGLKNNFISKTKYDTICSRNNRQCSLFY
jgi:glycerol kinase